MALEIPPSHGSAGMPGEALAMAVHSGTSAGTAKLRTLRPGSEVHARSMRAPGGWRLPGAGCRADAGGAVALLLVLPEGKPGCACVGGLGRALPGALGRHGLPAS